MSKHNLTVKQKAFADHYIKTGNATQSYKDAGYKWTTDKVASSNSLQLLANQRVKAYIERRSEKIDNKVLEEQINVRNEINRRIKEVSTVDFANNVVKERQYTEIDEEGNEIRVSERIVPVRMNELKGMLELLAKVDGTLTGEEVEDYEIVTIEDDIE